jgi:hypothetical protein
MIAGNVEPPAATCAVIGATTIGMTALGALDFFGSSRFRLSRAFVSHRFGLGCLL